jgi:hypothetical protein
MEKRCGICNNDKNVVPKVLGAKGPVCLGCCALADNLVRNMVPRTYMNGSVRIAEGLYAVAFRTIQQRIC